MRLLLIEDDEVLAQTLSTALRTQHYVVEMALDGEEGWEYAKAFTYDLILLDVSLPKLDGISLCRRLRQEGYQEPILLLTALGDSANKVAGLDAGADDYVVKPCKLQELFARIRALLRRPHNSGTPVLEWGDLRLDPSTCECTYNSVPLNASPKEYNLLYLFLRHPRRVLSRSTILEHLWSFEDPPREDTVRAHVKGLRRKLKDVGAPDVIETVYGLGYRLKQIKAAEKSIGLIEDTYSKKYTKEQHLSVVQKAWARYKEPILDRLSTLEEAAAAFEAGTLTEELRLQAQSNAHKLVGSLGMFGCDGGSQLARDIENWLEEESQLIHPDKAQLTINKNPQAIVALLRQEIQEKKVTGDSVGEPPDRPTETEVSFSNSGSPREVEYRRSNHSCAILLVVDADVELTQGLIKEAKNWSMSLEVARNATQARAAIATLSPDLILLDLSIGEGLVLLEELSSYRRDIPVLCWAQRDEFSDRLAVARLGAKRYLPKPVSPIELFEIVREVLQANPKSEAKVLAVDDDRLLLKILEQFLEPYGIELHTLQDPRDFWPTLETIAPDLLILDVEMPHFNGIELCQVVRNDITWSGLPILFVTAHRDSKTIDRLYQAGADDYISKPVTEPELVTRIFNRIERTRLLLRIEEVDQLTGVATRRNATKQLNRYLDLCQRHHQLLCIGLLDLDNFKWVNNQYSHLVGDQVLQGLGQILRQHFRSEDIVARWGGQEFLVGMYGLTKADGMSRLNEVLQMFLSQVFSVPSSPEQQLRVTFSAGFAEYPTDGRDLHSLYLAADRHLHEVKAAR